MEEICHVARARGIPLADDIVAQMMALMDTVTPSGTCPCSATLWQGSVQTRSVDRRGGASGAEASVATPVHAFLYASLLPMELRARGEMVFPA